MVVDKRVGKYSLFVGCDEEDESEHEEDGNGGSDSGKRPLKEPRWTEGYERVGRRVMGSDLVDGGGGGDDDDEGGLTMVTTDLGWYVLLE